MPKTEPYDSESTRWGSFILKTRNRSPVHYIDKAAVILGNRRGRALDLGCGAGVDSRHLAKLGFAVHAIDINSEAIISTTGLCEGLPVTVSQCDIRKFVILMDEYDLVIAWRILPFIEAESLSVILRDIERGLAPGGVFVFGIFGPRDDWAMHAGVKSFMASTTIQSELRSLHLIELTESCHKGPDATGRLKSWHTIQGIAQKQNHLRARLPK